MKAIFHCMVASMAISSALGAIKSEVIEYKEGETTLEGVLVYDDAIVTKRPGILIAHQWKGLSDYERKRAEMLARLGYVAFAADIYGKGVRPADPKAAGEMAGKYKADRDLLRRRVRAGLEQLRRARWVDQQKIGAIGYCFGGTTVLELARSGADVGGVVSFHGALGTPTPGDAKNIKARVLACHGADDPFVPATEVAAFEQEMRDAKVDWQLVAYGNSVHSFTDWNAGNDNAKGSAYNEKADKRSWEAMKDFFNEVFGGSGKKQAAENAPRR
jgi:dienelactone hydrolase